MTGTTIIHCGNPTCTRTIEGHTVDGNLLPLIERAGWVLVVGDPFPGLDEHGLPRNFDAHHVAMCRRCA